MINFIVWLIVGAIIGWLASQLMGKREGLLLNIVVGIVGAFLAGLDGLMGPDGGVPLRIEPEDHAHELAWPEVALRVLKGSFQFDCSGGSVDVIVDER